MTSRQFRLHIASILERKRLEEVELERATTKPATATRKAAPPKPVSSRQPEAVVEKKPPAAVYEPKIQLRMRRSK